MFLLWSVWDACGVDLCAPHYLELILLQQLCSGVNPTNNEE